MTAQQMRHGTDLGRTEYTPLSYTLIVQHRPQSHGEVGIQTRRTIAQRGRGKTP